MAKPKVKIRSKGAREVLKSAGVQSELQTRAADMAMQAGYGYEATVYPWRTRARSSVITGNAAARSDNSRNQTLARVLAAARAR